MMKVTFSAVVLSTAVSLSAQAPQLRSEKDAVLLKVGEPLLGFAAEPGSNSIRCVVGTGTKPHFGFAIPLPSGTAKIYLAPLERYALVENSADGGVTVWSLKDAATALNALMTVLPGSAAHPESVAFSPTGSVVVTANDGEVQVFNNLLGEPHLVREIPTNGRRVSSLGVTDDARLLVAQFDDGEPYYALDGQRWTALATGVRPRAWTFLPHTHDLAVSDSVENAIVLLPAVAEGRSAERVLAGDISANRLATTSDADELVAASGVDDAIWEIPLAAGARLTRVQFANVSTLATLRDGHAFLLSSSPNLIVLRAVASQLHVAQ